MNRGRQLSLALALICLSAASALGQETANYDLTVRPDPVGVPTEVSIGVFVLDLVVIDDLEQEFTADLFANVRWQDARLAASGASSAERVLPLAQVWNPAVKPVSMALAPEIPEAP